MYHSHPSAEAYGNPGYFVDKAKGRVRDASGRWVELTSDMSERAARRLLIRTGDLPHSKDGVYTVRLRKAIGVSAIRLSYASIPRSISSVTAQLVLYSINIKHNLTQVGDKKKVALQRFCRNQLLSNDCSDFPFFSVSKSTFDWRESNSTSCWINGVDQNTHIPPQLEYELTNQYVDIDTLTVKVPSMCTLGVLGHAFQRALKSHSGSKDSKSNSLWNEFDISVEDTGFSVFENINVAESLNTFASIHTSEMLKNSAHTQPLSAHDTLQPLGTPLTIKLKKSRSAFVAADALNGTSTAPADVSTSASIMTEFVPIPSTEEGGDVFTVHIDTPNRSLCSFSFPKDVSVDDILEVSYKPIVELSVQSLPLSGNTTVTFPVSYYYGTRVSVNNDSSTLHFLDNVDHIFEKSPAASLKFSLPDPNHVTLSGEIEWDVSTGILTVKDGGKESHVFIQPGISFFVKGQTNQVVNVSQVSRTYQKHRDIRLGLRWDNHEEDDHFVIDSNHRFDCPLIKTKSGLNDNYSFRNGPHRTDVALLSHHTCVVRASVRGSSSNIVKLNKHTGVISSGMKVTSVHITNPESVFVQTVIDQTDIQLNQNVDLDEGDVLTFHIPDDQIQAEQINNTFYNLLRSNGELQDTYVEPSSGMTELYNVREFNDSHQMQNMLFAGHVMNVEEPTPMPVGTGQDHGVRPPTEVSGSNTPIHGFYSKGLGWETSVVHKSTRFVMPAFPVRFTELDNPNSTQSAESIYSIDGTASVHTSISPLVARILSVTRIQDENLAYYKLQELNDALEPVVQDENKAKSSNNALHALSYYEPRDVSKCGIVVTIGDQNYVVKSARLVSVLKNNTEFTLNLCCDRNHNSEVSPLSSSLNIQRMKDTLKRTIPGAYRDDLEQNILKAESNKQHAFYTLGSNRYEPNSNAKYFSWVFELDRHVQLPSGINDTFYAGNDIVNPAITSRTFNGVVDKAAMFVPGVYERVTGRPAVSDVQQAAHSFFVRSGSEESEDSLLVLHDLGTIERPLNSQQNIDGHIFALMAEPDLKKPEKMVCENTVWLRNTENIEKIDFHFINSRSGKKIDIGKQNATLLLDIFCENE